VASKNCWEFKGCGRETGGANAVELGVCPSYEETRADGVNGGRNGGRSCWAIAGTLCGGEPQGTFARELRTCLECDFYKKVRGEEGRGLVTAREILSIMF
jgi:hypothetical protein